MTTKQQLDLKTAADGRAGLVCPVCRGVLNWQADDTHCGQCEKTYATIDNIPILIDPARHDGPHQSGKDYTTRFQNPGTAINYDQSFKQGLRKRHRTRRELEILSTLLGLVTPIREILNLPAGGARLSEPIYQAGSEIYEADSSLDQLRICRSYATNDVFDHTIWFAASGFSIPLPDGKVDGSVCARLSHHFSQAADRLALLTELARVSRRFILFSFADRKSVKNTSRRIRGKAVTLTSMNESELRTMCDRLDLQISKIMSVSPLGSRHRYALLLK